MPSKPAGLLQCGSSFHDPCDWCVCCKPVPCCSYLHLLSARLKLTLKLKLHYHGRSSKAPDEPGDSDSCSHYDNSLRSKSDLWPYQLHFATGKFCNMQYLALDTAGWQLPICHVTRKWGGVRHQQPAWCNGEFCNMPSLVKIGVRFDAVSPRASTHLHLYQNIAPSERQPAGYASHFFL